MPQAPAVLEHTYTILARIIHETERSRNRVSIERVSREERRHLRLEVQ